MKDANLRYATNCCSACVHFDDYGPSCPDGRCLKLKRDDPSLVVIVRENQVCDHFEQYLMEYCDEHTRRNQHLQG